MEKHYKRLIILVSMLVTFLFLTIVSALFIPDDSVEEESEKAAIETGVEIAEALT